MRDGHIGLKVTTTNMAKVGVSTQDPLETQEREMLPMQVTTQGRFTALEIPAPISQASDQSREL